MAPSPCLCFTYKGDISFAFQSPDDDVRGKHIWCDLVPEVRNIKYIKWGPEVYSFCWLESNQPKENLMMVAWQSH